MLKRKWSNKQYCGDVETDPFEFAYRGSVFDPYKESNKVPTVEEHSLDGSHLDTVELIEDIQLPAHRLSAKVRHEYLYYLDRVLRKNYHSWLSCYGNQHDNPFSDDELRQCAETIEMRAVQSCMITSLYRNFILQTIAEIRKQTARGMIHPNLTDVKFKPALIKREQCHVGVQTDVSVHVHRIPTSVREDPPVAKEPMLSLEEKMRIFERDNVVEERFPSEVTSGFYSEPLPDENAAQKVAEAQTNYCPTEDTLTATKPQNDAMDDEILKELQAMFEPADEAANLFEWDENQDQVKAIINEIENSAPFPSDHSRENPRPVSTPSPKLDRRDLRRETPRKDTAPAEDLRCSMWPCELHMQRMKLRSLLVRIAEENYRWYERLVQTRFVTLFGVDDGEEQDLGPYSPSIELNEVLVSSCRQRIAKWVVQALMRPLNDGLIGNRFLFKKLAKRLADSIIYANQYPDKKFIREYVDEYFCSHVQIRSIEDIT